MSDKASSTRSYLGPGCVFEGNIRGSGSLECHGSVTGTVTLDGDVAIGERGRAKGTLCGDRITVDGYLDGDANGIQKVEVGATGRVTGDIRAPSVVFAEGAVFEGNVEIRATDKAGKEAPQ